MRSLAGRLARSLTCIALRRELASENERRMRASGKLSAAMPRRTAVLLNAAIAAVEARSDGVISTGKCLAIIAAHFHEIWSRAVKPRNTRSRQVRERDLHRCLVPGCSHRGSQSHHVDYRSHGGSDDLDNQVALCPFHHLFCIHGGCLKVVGLAPDGLRWFLLGVPWSGPGREAVAARGE